MDRKMIARNEKSLRTLTDEELSTVSGAGAGSFGIASLYPTDPVSALKFPAGSTSGHRYPTGPV